MTTFLAQNQFISNPSVISPRTERSAVASKPPPAADATAAPFVEPSMTMEVPEEASAPAPTKNPDADALEDKLDWREFFEAVTDDRFVLFELTDEVPLFIRDGEHLRRWEA